jgi:hypothetical protein
MEMRNHLATIPTAIHHELVPTFRDTRLLRNATCSEYELPSYCGIGRLQIAD